MKTGITFLMSSAILFLGTGCGFVSQPVTFQSLESKTASGDAVFNQVQFIAGETSDTWLMKQSHFGPHVALGEWDQIAIVVDKTVSPKTAKFYQLKSNAQLNLDSSDPFAESDQVSLKATCFQCHNNGPRAIRPIFDSADFSLGLKERALVFWWNLKMKSYGRVVADEGDVIDGGQGDIRSLSATEKSVPFRHLADFDNAPMKLKACVGCHHDGEGGRGFLRRQQGATIEFAIAEGLMPPKKALSSDERIEIEKFLAGL